MVQGKVDHPIFLQIAEKVEDELKKLVTRSEPVFSIGGIQGKY
jgi:hypothetical protein